jgi:hypothetical protein
LPDVSAAREEAVAALRHLVGEAIKHGRQNGADAILVTDQDGRRVVAVPMVAALPPMVIEPLIRAADNAARIESEEYRQYADECRRMAENAIDARDRTSWLKLAEAWLQMLPRGERAEVEQGWPKPSAEDSQASH